MSQRRVCDACAVRRVRCDGLAPCAGCLNASLECTRIRQRHKSGPKGIKKKTLERLASIKRPQQLLRDEVPGISPPSASGDIPQDLPPQGQPQQTASLDNPGFTQRPLIYEPQRPHAESHAPADGLHDNPHQLASAQPDPSYPFSIGVDQLSLYLDIYHHKLYPVWPIVHKTSLAARLQPSIPDVNAYILASSISAATILQLQLTATDARGSTLRPAHIIDEIDALRRAQDYREHPSLDSCQTSFFLHVALLHLRKQKSSTLMLREAISVAHLLDFHKPAHYEDVASSRTNKDDLRTLWLLFITERAHTLQYDLPCTLAVPSDLPTPRADDEPFMLSAFISLCNMFKALAEASTDASQTALILSHSQMLQLPASMQPYNQLQKADVGVTQHWMRLHLWKLAVSRIKMTTEPGEDITSILFPLQAARDLLADMSAITVDSLEAHGSGMELKLFEFANTIADVMVCMPHRWTQDTRIGPREYLAHLGKILGNFRGGNEALLPLLRSRFTELGLSLPDIPRLVDVTHESSDSSPARLTQASGGMVPWFADETAWHERELHRV